MTTPSRNFGKKAPVHSHLLTAHGLSKEVLDVRSDVEEAFQGLESAVYGVNTSPNLAQAAWFVDPSNTSGKASDDNNGATSTTPLKTKKELQRRIGSQNGAILTAAGSAMIVTFLSEEPDNTDNTVLDFDTTLCGLIINFPLIDVITDTLTAATAKVRSTGAALTGRQTVTAGNQASAAFWTAQVGNIFESITANARAWVRSDSGSKVAVISSLATIPALPGFNLGTQYYNMVQVDPGATDAFKTKRPANIHLGKIVGRGRNGVYLTGLNSTQFVTEIEGQVTSVWCKYQFVGIAPGAGRPFFANCYISGNVISIAGSTASAAHDAGVALGAIVTHYLDGDVLVAGAANFVRGCQLGLVCFETLQKFGAKGSTNEGGTFSVIKITGPGGVAYGSAIIWGVQTAACITVEPDAKIQWEASQTAVATFLVPLAIEPGGANAALPFDMAAVPPAFKAAVSLTPANLDLAVASGGFGGCAIGFKRGTIMKAET